MRLAASDAIAALLAGNAVVLKPDSQTPYCALACVELLYKAGLPRDLFAVVPGPGSVVGTALVENTDYLMFTGSTATGQLLAEQAGRRLIGFSAELRSEEHTSELQSLMRISYAVFCLKKKKKTYRQNP